MAVKISIVNQVNKSNWCNKLSSLSYENTQHTQKADRLIIDFKNNEAFLEPFHIVSLACLIEEYKKNGIDVDIIPPQSGSLKDYLDNIRFSEYWDPLFNQNRYTNTNITTNLCLWKIDHSMIDEYSRVAMRYFEENYLLGKDLHLIITAFAELFNNINDHSNSNGINYSLAQYYPNKPELKICVCDFGVGIAANVNNYLKEKSEPQLSDDKAILKAIELGFTTKSQRHNRGFGLDTLKTQAITSNGMLRILSNKGVVKINNQGIESFCPNSHDFSGTIVELIINTNTLEDKEESYLMEDFHF